MILEKNWDSFLGISLKKSIEDLTCCLGSAPQAGQSTFRSSIISLTVSMQEFFMTWLARTDWRMLLPTQRRQSSCRKYRNCEASPLFPKARMKFSQIPYWKQLKMYQKYPSLRVQNLAVQGQTKVLKSTKAVIRRKMLSRILRQMGRVSSRRKPTMNLCLVCVRQVTNFSQAKKQMMPLWLLKQVISEMKLIMNYATQQTPIFLARLISEYWYLWGMGKWLSFKSIGYYSFDSLEESFTCNLCILSSDLLYYSSSFSILFYYLIFSLRSLVTSLFLLNSSLNQREKRTRQMPTMTQKRQGIESSILKGSCNFLMPRFVSLYSPLTR